MEQDSHLQKCLSGKMRAIVSTSKELAKECVAYMIPACTSSDCPSELRVSSFYVRVSDSQGHSTALGTCDLLILLSVFQIGGLVCLLFLVAGLDCSVVS